MEACFELSRDHFGEAQRVQLAQVWQEWRVKRREGSQGIVWVIRTVRFSKTEVNQWLHYRSILVFSKQTKVFEEWTNHLLLLLLLLLSCRRKKIGKTKLNLNKFEYSRKSVDIFCAWRVFIKAFIHLDSPKLILQVFSNRKILYQGNIAFLKMLIRSNTWFFAFLFPLPFQKLKKKMLEPESMRSQGLPIAPEHKITSLLAFTNWTCLDSVCLRRTPVAVWPSTTTFWARLPIHMNLVNKWRRAGVSFFLSFSVEQKRPKDIVKLGLTFAVKYPPGARHLFPLYRWFCLFFVFFFYFFFWLLSRTYSKKNADLDIRSSQLRSAVIVCIERQPQLLGWVNEAFTKRCGVRECGQRVWKRRLCFLFFIFHGIPVLHKVLLNALVSPSFTTILFPLVIVLY